MERIYHELKCWWCSPFFNWIRCVVNIRLKFKIYNEPREKLFWTCGLKLQKFGCSSVSDNHVRFCFNKIMFAHSYYVHWDKWRY